MLNLRVTKIPFLRNFGEAKIEILSNRNLFWCRRFAKKFNARLRRLLLLTAVAGTCCYGSYARDIRA